MHWRDASHPPGPNGSSYPCEDRIGSPLEEDLKMWRHSGLARQTMSGQPVEWQSLGISDHQGQDVKAVLNLANGQ